MKKRAVTNWTSTKVPLWEMDCVQYWRAGHPFELQDVWSEEHHLFVAQFASAHDLVVSREGDRVIFHQRPAEDPGPGVRRDL